MSTAMSTLYIANTDYTASAGVWRVDNSVYQYQYSSFIPGNDVDLDQVSIRTVPYGNGQSAPNNFQAGIYAAGIDSLTPGSLIASLSGPSSPVPNTYNDFVPTSAIGLESGVQYWLGFTLASDTGGDSSTRVRIGVNNGNFTTLGAGWSAQSSRYRVDNTGGTTEPEPLVYSLYATPRAVCFVKGTMILMPDGSEKPIEKLCVGELVDTSKGSLPIKWVARRTIRRDLFGQDKYEELLPVRLKAGSLGDGLPSMDLLVSEFHGIYADEAIVNAGFLVNSLNIYKEKLIDYPSEINYFHLEFEDEVLVFANAVGACSYVNRGNRRSFDNYPEFISLYGSADLTVKSLITKLPRNRPSLEGHKSRVKRSWLAH